MKDKTSKQKKWIKPRHRVIFAIFRPFFKLFLKLRYNFSWSNDEKTTPKNCIIFCNHQTVLDPFMVATSFKRPIFYMMNDDLFTLGWVSKLISFLVEPIPKSKSKADLNAIRLTTKVLKEGGTVGIFPEGNRTLSGELWGIDSSAAKLAKISKVPLVLYKLSGGFGSDPRWGGSVRKGKMTGKVVKILYPEQIEKMSNDQLLDEINNALGGDEADLGWNFKSKKRAEYIERSAYCCPECKSFNSIYSSGNYIYCKNCHFTAEYTADLKVKKIKGETFGDKLSEWYTAQQKELVALTEKAKENEILFFDDDVELRKISGRNREYLGSAKISATTSGIVIKNEKSTYGLEFSELYGATVLGKRKINFYVDDKNTLQIKGSKRFNAIKYLHLYNLKKGE